MAQSAMARSPLGVNFFWDKGHQPELDWDKWLSTVKLTIMVKDNIPVEKLLQPKPESEELDYPAQPDYEPPQPDETTAKKDNVNSAIKKGKPIGKTNAKQLKKKDQW